MGISEGLTAAGVDIIELGFLRGNVDYKGNSTYFTEVEQFKKFIPKDRRNSMFVAFADYGKEFGMWDFSKLPECDGSSFTGMRIGFPEKGFIQCSRRLQARQVKGYTLFIQGVESLNYTDKEMLEAIEVINDIHPACFGIVDTYGAMYKGDVLRLFTLVHNNLAEDIAIDFHSHNNLQLSFSFAQEIVEVSAGKREVVIDATLEGVGKGIGNLNTELIMDYLNRKHSYTYDIDRLFDTIDESITWLKKEHTWAYQIPYFMAGIFGSHANNIIYLMEKHKLSTKDIKHILSMIEPEKRKRYDYDNIERLYIEYVNSKGRRHGGVVPPACRLGRAPGAGPRPGPLPGQLQKKEIDEVIEQQDPVVISVNFVDGRGRDRISFLGTRADTRNAGKTWTMKRPSSPPTLSRKGARAGGQLQQPDQPWRQVFRQFYDHASEPAAQRGLRENHDRRVRRLQRRCKRQLRLRHVQPQYSGKRIRTVERRISANCCGPFPKRWKTKRPCASSRPAGSKGFFAESVL